MLTSRGGTRVLADLAEIGYNAEWTIISARDVGARHLRKRIWIVAYPDNSGSGTSRYETDKDRQKEDKGREEFTQSEPSGHSTKVSDTTGKGLQGTIGAEHERTGERPAKRSGEVSDTNSRRLERSSQKQRRTGNAVGNNRKATETRLSKGTTYWKTEPNVGRVVNGLSSRVDRIKGLGNAIVPQVAVVILNKIKNGM